MVQVKADHTVCLALFPLNEDGKPLAKALENFGNRDFEFDCQGLGQRVFEDILNAVELSPVIGETIVILDTMVHAAVQMYDLVSSEKCPSSLRSRFAFQGAKSSLAQSLDEFGEWSVHHRLPAGGTTFECLSGPVGRLFKLGLAAVASLEGCAEEKGFFGARIGDVRFFLGSGSGGDDHAETL
jgi:hypothetical protein